MPFRSDVKLMARVMLGVYLLVKPALMLSRMKALCWTVWVSKHSPGSSTHIFSHALIPPLVCGLGCVCFIHGWPADLHLCELQSASQTGRSTCSCLPNQTRQPLQDYSMFYSPLTPPPALPLSFSALISPRGTSGAFPWVHYLPRILPTGYIGAYGGRWLCAFDFSCLALSIN